MKKGLLRLRNYIRMVDEELWNRIGFRWKYAGSRWFLQQTVPSDKRKFMVVMSDQPWLFASWRGNNVDSGRNEGHIIKIEVQMKHSSEAELVEGEWTPEPTPGLNETYIPIVEYEENEEDEDEELIEDDMYPSTQEYIERVKRSLPTQQLTLAIMPPHTAAPMTGGNHQTGGNGARVQGGTAMDVDS